MGRRLGIIKVPADHPACTTRGYGGGTEGSLLEQLSCPPDTRLLAVTPHAFFSTNEWGFKIEHPLLPELVEPEFAWEGPARIPFVKPRWRYKYPSGEVVIGYKRQDNADPEFDGWEVLSG